MTAHPSVLAGCRMAYSQNSHSLQDYLPTPNLLAPPVDVEVVEVGIGFGRLAMVVVVVLTADR